MTEIQQGGPLASPEMSVKLFVKDESGVKPLELIPVFHRWIRDSLLEDELMIDVANYEHVPKGPGIALICDHAHYYFDERHGRWGLRYRGRRVARGSGEEAIAEAFRRALRAASLLQSAPELEGRYPFRTDEVEFGIFDRLLAPSSDETLAAVEVGLQPVLKGLYGGDVAITRTSDEREPFEVSIKAASSPGVDELLAQLAPVAG